MAGLVPAIHAGNASKTGPTWGAARSKVLQAQSFRPCRAHEHSMRRTTWIAGTKSGHDALKLVRRSPHNPDSDDQQRTQQEPQCARAIGGDGLPVISCYQREESAFAARAIYDRVAQKVARENVFLDADNIDPGVDWFEALNERVAACDALVAVIGRNWVAAAACRRTSARRRASISSPPTKETLLRGPISGTSTNLRVAAWQKMSARREDQRPCSWSVRGQCRRDRTPERHRQARRLPRHVLELGDVREPPVEGSA
jgi:hypothetical protein